VPPFKSVAEAQVEATADAMQAQANSMHAQAKTAVITDSINAFSLREGWEHRRVDTVLDDLSSNKFTKVFEWGELSGSKSSGVS
jgi:hypothetical protein